MFLCTKLPIEDFFFPPRSINADENFSFLFFFVVFGRKRGHPNEYDKDEEEKEE